MNKVTIRDFEDWEIIEEMRGRGISTPSLSNFDDYDLLEEIADRGMETPIDPRILANNIVQRMNMKLKVDDLIDQLLETITGRMLCK